MIIWITGISGAGKTTIARALISKFKDKIPYMFNVDGDEVRELFGSSLGYSEELTENNFFAPAEEDYVTADQVYYEESDIEDWDISEAKPGLWDNIRKKKEREGKNYNPAKPGDPDRPDPKSWKKAQKKKNKSATSQFVEALFLIYIYKYILYVYIYYFSSTICDFSSNLAR